jgi:hypothetical protein
MHGGRKSVKLLKKKIFEMRFDMDRFLRYRARDRAERSLFI